MRQQRRFGCNLRVISRSLLFFLSSSLNPTRLLARHSDTELESSRRCLLTRRTRAKMSVRRRTLHEAGHVIGARRELVWKSSTTINDDSLDDESCETRFQSRAACAHAHFGPFLLVDDGEDDDAGTRRKNRVILSSISLTCCTNQSDN